MGKYCNKSAGQPQKVGQTKKEHSKPSKTNKKLKIGPSYLRGLIKKRMERIRTSTDKPTVPSGCPSKQNGSSIARLVNSVKEQNLSCPICLDLCVYPVCTECGHYYCLPCFEEFHQKSTRCCVCRSDINITNYETSTCLKNIFQEYIQTHMDWAEAEIYWSRVEEITRKEAKRNVPENIRVGEMIDIWAENKWTEGRILSVSQKALEVEPLGSAKEGVQVVSISKTSRMIAKHHVFTKQSFKVEKAKPIAPIVQAVAVPVAPVREEPSQVNWTETELEGIEAGRINRQSWDLDIFNVRQQNQNISMMEQSEEFLPIDEIDFWGVQLSQDFEGVEPTLDQD